MSRPSVTAESKEIWSILKEMQKNSKEMQKNSKEIQRNSKEIQKNFNEMQKNSKEIQKKSKETQKSLNELSESQKETDRHLNKISNELSESQKETDRHLNKISNELSESQKETDKAIKSVIGDFGNRWGRLGENLVKGSLVRRLKERGIKVEKVITNAKNAFSEFDIIAINGKETVVVEVKATLDPSDVKKFAENIKNFKVWWPEFKNKKIYGAMAFLIKANRQAGDFAEKQGFFVISATGDVIIQNEEDFKPKVFS